MSRFPLFALALLLATLLLPGCGAGDAPPSECSLTNLPACGGGGAGGTGGGGGGPPPEGPPPSGPPDPAIQVGSIVLVFGATELPSAGTGGEGVAVSALVRSAANTALAGVPVEFGADSGILAVVTPVTDAAGRASALIDTGGDRRNRLITVAARVGAQQASAQVAVTGTRVELSGPGHVALGAGTTYVARVLDSAGAPIAYVPVGFTSSAGNTLSAATVATDALGQATLTLIASARGSDVLSASAMGAQATRALTVLADDVSLQPAVTYDGNGGEILPQAPLGACVALRARSAISSSGSMSFATSRGQLYTDAACSVPLAGSVAFSTPDVAPVYLRSTSSGVATVDAMLAGGGGGSTRIDIVAPLTASATLSLQSDMAVLRPGETATLLAIVRDGTAANNLVKGAPVSFAIVADPSGGTLHSPLTVITGSDGIARASFTGGVAGSPSQGVQISARLGAPATASADARLTVSGKALSIQFGTGNVLLAYSPTTLQQDYTVFVTDASGNPVPGVALRVSAWPLAYRKGRYKWFPESATTLEPGVWAPDLDTAFECANEDAARAGLYDSAFDLNGNGTLEPGIPLTVSVAATSDANGMAVISLRYPRDRANWIRAELTVTGTVAGTESLARHATWLQPLATDLGKPYVPPPGQVSPYGIEACTSAN